MGLIESWEQHAQAAQAWEPGRELEPVLGALALTVALELTGELGRVARAEREALKRVGQRALLHVGATDDEDELEALRLSAALARDGLRALSGRPPADGAPSGLPVPAEELVRLAEGRLDGLSAGALAIRIRRDPRARAELSLLLELREPEVAPL
ncbi:MAG: hypothetical protein IT378_25545, partial [Sandaracinaceae bacterium]|nr:hypothetical protein [Sandaracinaceae bacterium]